MASPSFERDRIPFYLTFAAAVAPLFSGAVCNILIGMALASLIWFRVKPKMPPVVLPLGIFFLWTAASIALSADPWTGRTGIRKFYLFFLMMLVTTTFRTLGEARALVWSWLAVMTGSAAYSMIQFFWKYEDAQAAGQSFYAYYTGERITGFMSHWMTLGGQEMTVLLLGAAMLFFGSRVKLRWMLGALAVILVSLLAGYTRSIWLGSAVAGLYLIWNWKRWAVALTPVPVAVLLIANPADIRERVRSAFEPHGDTDSNLFRVVCRRTGEEMIKAHPWFGLGPEQPRVQFMKWVPEDVKRPLPTGWYGHLHNIYYHYAAERGLPALAALLWWMGKMLYDFAGALRRAAAPDARFLLHGAVASVIGVMLTGIYEFNLGDAEVLSLFLAAMSLGYLAREATG